MTTSNVPAPIAPWAVPAAQDRSSALAARFGAKDSAQIVRDVAGAAERQMEQVLNRGLGLYAGSNIMSPDVQSVHLGGLSTRPALGWPGDKVQPLVGDIEALEVIANSQLRRAFNASFAEPRFLSATMANLAAYTAFAAPGDTIAILPPSAGSHISHQAQGTAGIRGLEVAWLPYDARNLDLDFARLPDFLSRVRPRLVLIGGSVIQFPNDLPRLRSICDRAGCRLVFDASHVAGLIAAGEFPNPLDEGADLMTMSTYKTLAGPAGGASVTNDAEVAQAISDALYPMLSSNYDPARMGPLAVAAAEAIEQRPSWARETIEVARGLGAELDRRGFALQGADRGYTDSHQIVLDASRCGGGLPAMRELERYEIAVGACRLAGQADDEAPLGLRLGTQELVRLGAYVEHCAPIAEVVSRILHRGSGSGSGSAPAPGPADGALAAAVQEIRDSFGPDIWSRSH